MFSEGRRREGEKSSFQCAITASEGKKWGGKGTGGLPSPSFPMRETPGGKKRAFIPFLYSLCCKQAEKKKGKSKLSTLIIFYPEGRRKKKSQGRKKEKEGAEGCHQRTTWKDGRKRGSHQGGKRVEREFAPQLAGEKIGEKKKKKKRKKGPQAVIVNGLAFLGEKQEKRDSPAPEGEGGRNRRKGRMRLQNFPTRCSRVLDKEGIGGKKKKKEKEKSCGFLPSQYHASPSVKRLARGKGKKKTPRKKEEKKERKKKKEEGRKRYILIRSLSTELPLKNYKGGRGEWWEKRKKKRKGK